jgi:hypothetical protein
MGDIIFIPLGMVKGKGKGSLKRKKKLFLKQEQTARIKKK